MCDRGLNFEMNQKLFCHEELTDEQVFTACLLTARQYGEVVLPDEASGQGPGTLGTNLSRCEEGMARVFAVQVQILLRAGAIQVQV